MIKDKEEKTDEETITELLLWLQQARDGEYHSFALEDGRYFQIKRK